MKSWSECSLRSLGLDPAAWRVDSENRLKLQGEGKNEGEDVVAELLFALDHLYESCLYLEGNQQSLFTRKMFFSYAERVLRVSNHNLQEAVDLMLDFPGRLHRTISASASSVSK